MTAPKNKKTRKALKPLKEFCRQAGSCGALWGWALAIPIITTQVVGNLANVVRGDFLRGRIGLTLAGALLLFLLRPQVRAAFIRKAFGGQPREESVNR